MRLFFTALCLYMIWGYSAAQAETNSTAAQISAPIKSVDNSHPKKLSIDLDLSADSNLRDSTDPEYQADTAIYITPEYKISDIWTVSAKLGMEQKLYADQKTDLADVMLTLSRADIDIGGDRAFNSRIFGYLPTNQIEREQQTFQGGTGAAMGITQSYALLKKEGSVGYTFSALKNYHEFESSNLGVANLSYRLRHIISVNQQISRKVSLDLIARYQTGWTYQNAMHTAFLLEESLKLALNDKSSVYVKHSNEGDALKANGVDSNIKVYDESQSTFTTGIEAKF